MAPLVPHAITVIVSDTRGSVLENASVFLRNITKKTNSSTKLTNSSGVTIFDLANLPDPVSGNKYDAGDKILIISYYQNQHNAASYIVVGDSHDQTLQMLNIPYNQVGGVEYSAQKLMQILTANTSGTVAYVKVFCVSDGSLLAHIETPSHDTKHVEFGSYGVGVGGGVVFEVESTSLVVTAVIR